MFRFLTGLASILVLLSATLFFPLNASARRCGEEPPKTLLSLYRKSTAIHIATFDRTDDQAVTEDDEHYSVVEVKHRFTVSSTIKGQTVKFVGISDTEYRSKNADETTEDTESEQGFTDPQLDGLAYGIGELKPGDMVMLFVKSGETEDSTVLTDYRGSAKKLSPERLAAFEKAIKELNGIFSGETVSDQAIVDWLVNTARDPLTRWEGAYELLSAVQNKEWRQAFENSIKEKLARGEQLEEWEKLDADKEEGEEHSDSANIKYADLLSKAQKQELVNVLLDSIAKQNDAEGREDEPTKAGQLSEGDRVLIELATRWGDDRLAVMMLDRLRNNADEAYETSQMMEKVAVMLKNEQLTKLASRYSNIFYMEDDEIIDNETIEANKEDDLDQDVVEIEESTEVEKVEKVKMTYGQLRTDLLGKFLEKADIVISDPERQLAVK